MSEFTASLTGVDPTDPTSTLQLMKARRLAASAGGPSAPMIGAGAQPMPQPTSQPQPSDEHPLVTGAKLANAVANPADVQPTGKMPSGMKDWHPGLIDLVKQYSDAANQVQPTDQDKGIALAQAGFGMAASSSPYFGQALGQGAMAGLQSLQQAKSQRAEMAMKMAQLQNEADYRNKSLEQSGTFQTGELANDAEQRRLQQAALDQAAKLQPSEIEKNRAAAASEYANVDWRKTMTQQLTGSPGAIPAAVLKIVGPIAQKQLAADPRYKDPDTSAAAYQQAIVPLAYDYMTQKGQSTDGISMFDPYRKPAADAAVARAAPPSGTNPPLVDNTVPWLKGTYAATPNPDAKIPILGNPALTAPGAKMKDLAQSVSGGTYDAGQLFNMGEADLINLHTDLLDLAKHKAGGMGLGEDQAKLIAQMIPHQKFLGSNPENADQFKSIYNNVLQQYTADTRMLNDPATEKGMRTDLGKRASLEATILNNLAGSKTADAYPRWGAIGANVTSAPSVTNDSHLDDLLNKYKPK